MSSHAFGKEKSCPIHEYGCSSDHEELDSDGEFPEGYKSTEDPRNIENSVDVALESFQQEKKIRLDISETSDDVKPLQCRYAEHSAVELLDNLQSKSLLLEDDPDQVYVDSLNFFVPVVFSILPKFDFLKEINSVCQI